MIVKNNFLKCGLDFPDSKIVIPSFYSRFFCSCITTFNFSWSFSIIMNYALQLCTFLNLCYLSCSFEWPLKKKSFIDGDIFLGGFFPIHTWDKQRICGKLQVGLIKFYSICLKQPIFLTWKVFLPVILNLIQIFTGIRQWRMKVKFKILGSDFKRESYKFILNYCSGFTGMMF